MQIVQVAALRNPPTGSLPKERKEGSVPYKFIGVDLTGSIKYPSKTKKEMKAHIMFYASSVTQGIYLALLPDQSAEEFLRSLKRFVARRGHPIKDISDNGKTFLAAAKWMRRTREQ